MLRVPHVFRYSLGVPPQEPEPYSDGSVEDIEVTLHEHPLPVEQVPSPNNPQPPVPETPSPRVWVIVNYIPPYKYEIAGVLGAITGAKTRFRFQSKYVQPADLNPREYGSPEVVICMRNRDTGSIIPLRLGELLSWRWIAEIAVFDVALGPLAIVPNTPEDRTTQRQAFTDSIAEDLVGFDNSGGQDLRKLVYVSQRAVPFISQAGAASTSHDTRWANLLSEIDEQYEDPGVDFVLVSAPRTSLGATVPTTTKDGIRGVRLTQGEQYHIELTQRTHTKKKGNSAVESGSRVVFSSESPDILIPQPSHEIKGKYSDTEMYFSVSRDARPGPRHASLLVSRSGAAPCEYEMELPLVVTRSRVRGATAAASLLIFGIGLIAYLAPHAVAQALEAIGTVFSIGPTPTDDSIEKASVVLMIAASMGNPMTRWLSDRLKVG